MKRGDEEAGGDIYTLSDIVVFEDFTVVFNGLILGEEHNNPRTVSSRVFAGFNWSQCLEHSSGIREP